MIVLFDTNVILDLLLDRRPFARDAARLVDQVARQHLQGLLGATTVTTIHYLARRSVGEAAAQRHVESLLSIFEVAPVGRGVLLDALRLGFIDYEDAVLHEAARQAGATAIVSRDIDRFKGAGLAIYQPAELLRALEAGPGRRRS